MAGSNGVGAISACAAALHGQSCPDPAVLSQAAADNNLCHIPGAMVGSSVWNRHIEHGQARRRMAALGGGVEGDALARPNQDGLCLYREMNMARRDEHQHAKQASKSPLSCSNLSHTAKTIPIHASWPGQTLREAG